MKTQNDDMKSIWKKGYGIVKHDKKTQEHIDELFSYLAQNDSARDEKSFYDLLISADRLTNAAMWLVAHQVYAHNVYLDGRELQKDDFKDDPQGHLGGSLNMVPAYVGYMLANALTNFTRGWVMGQGHCVAAIDSVNLLLNNMNDAHAKRYDLSEAGLTKFVRDFYSYKLNEKGEQDSPLGSHVNPHTAGGHLEGGYLGFASVQYPHMPLPREKLVAFLSDGAFEEQRGADWTPRWWRAEDCGSIAPIMILNGRRIDQRTTVEQEGGVSFFEQHLKLHGFDPIVFDGRDPAAFAWSIIEQERRLEKSTAIPYGIAVAPKGAGFYNEGTNYAHNLPLVENPHESAVAAERFNSHAQKLFVPLAELQQAIHKMQNHQDSKRALERDNPIANRNVTLKKIPEFNFRKSVGENVSPMDAIDEGFLSLVKANPHLRPRVGNPDEMLSNRMDDTLEFLKFRVVEAEEGAPESTLGKVITALNEEAVAGAAFGNKGGINMIVTYEAFGAKMLGGARQEVIFAKHKKDLGQPAKWLSIPIVLTSNTWENSKNELSHQDPAMAEAMLGESSDVSRVIFPADFNVALAAVKRLYQTQGEIWTVVVPKRKTPLFFTKDEAETLVKDGVIQIVKDDEAKMALVAIGAYQLAEVLKSSKRLKEKNIPHLVFYIVEPGKFKQSAAGIIPKNISDILLVNHTRPEIMLGVLHDLWRGRNVESLGFINRGGTLGVDDMLFLNQCSFAHILHRAEKMLGLKNSLLTTDESQALNGEISPDGVITKMINF